MATYWSNIASIADYISKKHVTITYELLKSYCKQFISLLLSVTEIEQKHCQRQSHI